MKEIFSNIYSSEYWTYEGKCSGPGSSLKATKDTIVILNKLIDKLEIKSIIDCGCGSLNWIINLYSKNHHL